MASRSQITIVPTGMLPKKFRPNQKVLVVDRTYTSCLQTQRKWKSKWTHKAVFSQPYHKAAKDVKVGDFFVFPRVKGIISNICLNLSSFVRKTPIMTVNMKNRSLPLNKEIAELIGYYIAKGFGTRNLQFAYDGNRKRIIHRTEYLIQKYLGYKTSIKTSKIMNTIVIRSGGTFGCRVFGNWCGNNKKSKKIPRFILYHKKLDILRSCLLAYYRAKGISANNIGLRTKSIILAHQLQLAFARLGLWLNMKEYKQVGKFKVKNRTVVTKSPYFYLLYSNDSSVRKFFGIKHKKIGRPTKHFYVANDNIYLRILKVI